MANSFEFIPLLQIKLYRPRLHGDVIRRPRVRAMLACDSDRAVTFVCAPAGFGKTTLLSDWLAECSMPNAWLSLDEQDSDLRRFVSYFIAAVRTIFPSACGDSLALLQGPVQPPPELLFVTLANDLDNLAQDPALARGQRFVLVLDDYHLVHDSAVHALVGGFLRHPPRTLHLILTARQDPPFDLHALRARRDFGEIRAPEMRFTKDEVAAFMAQLLGAPLDVTAVEILADRTEGWVTGLRLAAITMSTGGDATGPDLAADNRFVLEYLIKEVLSNVPSATQDFLLKTSILDRLCGPLCDALVEPAGRDWDGRAYLEWLAKENLFTFSLGMPGTWYRYHHLFATSLRGQLERRSSDLDLSELHRRAAGWFEASGYVEEALHHWLLAGDEMSAVRLVEVHRHEAMNKEHWRELERWLSLMPRRLLDSRPELLISEAWLIQRQWRFLDIPAYVERIAALMEQASTSESDRVRLSGELDVLRSLTLYYTFDAERTCEHAERALATVPLECSFVRAMAWYYYGAARQMTGDVQGALDAFVDGLKEDRLHGDSFPMRLYLGISMVHWMSADLEQMVVAARQKLQLAHERGLVEAVGFAHYLLGCAFYQLNELDRAEVEFATVVGQRYSAHAYAFSQSSFGLATVYLARGEGEKARAVIDSLGAYALETSNTRIMADATAFRAFLTMQTGAVADAGVLVESGDARTPLVPLTTFNIAALWRARILIASRTPANWRDASQILDRVHELATRTHNTRFLIEVVALQALLLEVQGDHAGSLTRLEQAVVKAEPSGLMRVFLDLGSRMAALLHQLYSRGTAPEYLQKLLAAFGDVQHGQVQAKQAELIEPLSDRELEVLSLLGDWLTNKEIARELCISPVTVKRHTVNIYQKLQVGGRRQAVARATALGLLEAAQFARRRSPISR